MSSGCGCSNGFSERGCLLNSMGHVHPEGGGEMALTVVR